MAIAEPKPPVATRRPNAGTAAYGSDIHAWAMEQAALLRRLRPAGLDVDNLAEEIESVGRQQAQEIENRLDQLLMHLLKARYQADQWKGGWQATIKVQRHAIKKVIRRNPSLKAYPALVLAEEYETARLLAAEETGLPEATFPEACPFTIDDILDDGFFG